MKTPAMRHLFQEDRAFRITFVLLAALALITLFWQCNLMPRGPSRVDWPANSSGAKKP
jgi:predicted MFS family arabinose efflux permease